MDAVDAEQPRRESCPSCGAEQSLIRVEHAALSGGRTYDRFFCASCCSSVEIHGSTRVSQPL
jgi:transposase-like protein